MPCPEGVITPKGGEGRGGGGGGISDDGNRVYTGGGSVGSHEKGFPVIFDMLCPDAPASVEEAAAVGSIEEAGVGEVETTDVCAEYVI
jgi:hypothetical protein